MEAKTIDEAIFRRCVLAAAGAFLFILVPLWLWVIFEPMAYRSSDFAILAAHLEIAREGRVGRLAILGGSCAETGLIPSWLGPDVSNFALSGAGPVEAYSMAKKILAAPTPPRAVLVSISPYYFVQPGTIWSSALPWGVLSAADAEEMRRLARALHDRAIFPGTSPGDIDARLNLFLHAIQFPAFEFPALVQSRLVARRESNLRILAKVLGARGFIEIPASNLRREAAIDASLTAFRPAPVLNAYFDRLLALMDREHVETYFVRAPINPATAQREPAGIDSDLQAYLQMYAARYPHFHLLDDSARSAPEHDFADQAHLNAAGAAKWTAQVAELLNRAHAPGGPYGVQSTP